MTIASGLLQRHFQTLVADNTPPFLVLKLEDAPLHYGEQRSTPAG